MSLVQKEKYQGSQRHRDNVQKATEIAARIKLKCSKCEREFTKGNIKRHEVACNKGKDCPVCKKWFRGNGVTCSTGCANTYFRTGKNNPNWKEDTYRSTCFHYHKKQCVICSESKIVEVHHLNGISTDNRPENLIPLCPTHHQYWHSRYKSLIESDILKYIANWKLIPQ